MRRVVLALLLLISLRETASAWTLQEQARFSHRDVAQLLGADRYVVDLQSAWVATNQGQLFLLARQYKTRALQWFLVDQRGHKIKIAKQGACPFSAFSLAAVSPDAQTAVVYSVFPVQIYTLRIGTGRWEAAYRNPTGSGLFLIATSPLAFVSNALACSLFDELDAEGFVKNSFIVSLQPALKSLSLVSKVVSLAALKSLAVAAVFHGDVPAGLKVSVDDLRFADGPTVVYILRTLNEAASKFVDYMLAFEPPDKVTLIDTAEGTLFPLDYDAQRRRILYLRNSAETSEVLLCEGKQKTTVLKAKAIVGAFFGKDLVGVCAVRGQSFQIFVGKRGEPLSRVIALRNPYNVAFLRDKPELVLRNAAEIRVYRAVP